MAGSFTVGLGIVILDVGSTKILRTNFLGSQELFENIFSKLEHITSQPNKLPDFIKNGSCSFHNVEEDGKKLYEWEEFKDFIPFLKEHVRDYLDSISVPEADVSIAGMWANRYPPGTYVFKHNHNNMSVDKRLIIGALFYIHMEENAGNLVIDIPQFGEYNVKMSQGDVVIFQSSLDHWTTPNKSNNDKYVIGLELVVGVDGKQLDEI